jgi:phage head maturation protease
MTMLTAPELMERRERRDRGERSPRPPNQGLRKAPFRLVRDAGDGGEPDDGLTLDGYGAVFNALTIIDSWEGRFKEKIAPGSMKRSFRETPPIIQFDHGRHPLIGSIPIASLRSISEDTHPDLAPEGGAHIIGRVYDNWLMQPVRDAIASDPPGIDGMSFRFEVVRDGWETFDGKKLTEGPQLWELLDATWWGDVPDDELPIRTLKELRVPEMGPVVWPAYTQTSVGMRSKVIDLGRLLDGDPDQRKLFARAAFALDATQSQRQPDANAQRSAGDTVSPAGERPAGSGDAQRSTPECVGERPSKPHSRREITLRTVQNMLTDIARKDHKP